VKHKSGAKHGSHHEGAGIDRKLHDPVSDRLIRWNRSIWARSDPR